MTDVQKLLTIGGLMAGGAVIGAGLGMVLAPQPGWLTRQRLRRYADRAQMDAAELAQRMKSRVDSTLEGEVAHSSREGSGDAVRMG